MQICCVLAYNLVEVSVREGLHALSEQHQQVFQQKAEERNDHHRRARMVGGLRALCLVCCVRVSVPDSRLQCCAIVDEIAGRIQLTLQHLLEV